MTPPKNTVVELCHTVKPGMTTYPGLPGPEIADHMSRADSRHRYADGTEFQIGRITLVANTGTYVDVPFHRFDDGADLSQVSLSDLVDLKGIVFRATHLRGAARGIGPELFEGHDVASKAVLVHTGWDAHWGTGEYGGDDHPYLSAEAVGWLIEHRATLVGIDSVNIDDMADLTRPAHTGLLEAGISIVEHMRGLGDLPDQGFTFHAAPVAVAGMGTFPVRAYALVPR